VNCERDLLFVTASPRVWVDRRPVLIGQFAATACIHFRKRTTVGRNVDCCCVFVHHQNTKDLVVSFCYTTFPSV
jgi:hypothetical protein